MNSSVSASVFDSASASTILTFCGSKSESCTCGDDIYYGVDPCDRGSTTFTVTVTLTPERSVSVLICMAYTPACYYTSNSFEEVTKSFAGSSMIDFSKFIEEFMSKDDPDYNHTIECEHFNSLHLNDKVVFKYDCDKQTGKEGENQSTAQKEVYALFKLLQKKCKEIEAGTTTEKDLIEAIIPLL
jgi:hypothetical protein